MKPRKVSTEATPHSIYVRMTPSGIHCCTSSYGQPVFKAHERVACNSGRAKSSQQPSTSKSTKTPLLTRPCATFLNICAESWWMSQFRTCNLRFWACTHSLAGALPWPPVREGPCASAQWAAKRCGVISTHGML